MLRHATVTIADLGGSYFGLADPSRDGIRIDDNAAGYGWFVDSTPGDDTEFAAPGNAAVRGRMDLLSAVAHELGHLLGLDHDDHAGGVMGAALAAGTRRTPMPRDGATASEGVRDDPASQTSPDRHRAAEALAWLWAPGSRRRNVTLFAEWLTTPDGAEM